MAILGVSQSDLILGGVVAAVAAMLGGLSGFGSSLVSAPILLLLGFPLPFVVTVNLTLVALTRVSVVYRFRDELIVRRVLAIVLGSVPGIALGSWVIANVNPTIIKRGVGVFIMLAVILLARTSKQARGPSSPGAPLVAGLLGGFCGATSSLNGVPAAILLARDRVAPRSFQANLALYFVLSNALTLALLAWRGTFVTEAIFPTAALWLPGCLAGNLAGAILSTRLSDRFFRRLTLVVAFLAGAVTAATA